MDFIFDDFYFWRVLFFSNSMRKMLLIGYQDV